LGGSWRTGNGKGNCRSLRDHKQKGKGKSKSDGKGDGNGNSNSNRKGKGNSKSTSKMWKLFGDGAVAELA
jgi:hypothetical protein